MNVIVEFKLNGFTVRAKVRAESVEEGVKEIQNTHPDCEIVAACRGSDDIKKDLRLFRGKK